MAEKVIIPYWLAYDSNPNIGNWHCRKCNAILLPDKQGDYPEKCIKCNCKLDWMKVRKI